LLSVRASWGTGQSSPPALLNSVIIRSDRTEKKKRNSWRRVDLNTDTKFSPFGATDIPADLDRSDSGAASPTADAPSPQEPDCGSPGERVLTPVKECDELEARAEETPPRNQVKPKAWLLGTNAWLLDTIPVQSGSELKSSGDTSLIDGTPEGRPLKGSLLRPNASTFLMVPTKPSGTEAAAATRSPAPNAATRIGKKRSPRKLIMQENADAKMSQRQRHIDHAVVARVESLSRWEQDLVKREAFVKAQLEELNTQRKLVSRMEANFCGQLQGLVASAASILSPNDVQIRVFGQLPAAAPFAA
jgi:hypothetical protein